MKNTPVGSLSRELGGELLELNDRLRAEKVAEV